MPTNPLESILYRDLSKAEAKDTIEIASPLLQEIVNYSTNALARCATSQNLSGKPDEDIAILALFRHAIELADGIEVLITQSCSIAAIPVVRSLFETLLSIEYILENNEKYTERSLSWLLVGRIHQRLDFYDRLNPTTNKGQETKKLFDDDKVMGKMAIAPIPPIPLSDVQKAKTNLQTMLEKTHVLPIQAEYIRTRSQNKNRNPEWYQLFGGPKNLYALAKHLKSGGQYEILYRQWSSVAHAQGLFPFETMANEIGIKRIRDASLIGEIASFTSTFLLSITRQVLKKLRPGEDLSIWFKRDIQSLYRSLRVKSATAKNP
jgi:hypothetical protein